MWLQTATEKFTTEQEDYSFPSEQSGVKKGCQRKLNQESCLIFALCTLWTEVSEDHSPL